MEAGAAAAMAREHFGQADLCDARRTRRLVRTASLILARPGGTLPSKLPDWSDLMGLYRLAGAEAVTDGAVTAPHRRRTLGRMRRERGVVLLVHDSTELDYTHVAALRDQLGQIGSGGGRGYVCHNTLAVTPDGRLLGLANQVLHRRRAVPRGEKRSAKRRHPGRESRLWLRGCEGVGPAPSGPGGPLWVDVCDRGADAIEFIEYEVRNGRHFVIRAARDRNLDGDDHVGADRIHRRLLGYARDLPPLGERVVAVPPAAGRSKARAARVVVSSGPLALRASRFARGECAGVPLGLWVVRVAEADPPPGAAPLEWVLLTDLPAGTFEEACERADWYGRRPVVEDYHKGLKTGVGVELPQLEDAGRLEPVIGLLSVAAAALLQPRHAARRDGADDSPATALVPPPYVRVLSGHLRKLYGGPRDDLTVRQFLLGVARPRRAPGPKERRTARLAHPLARLVRAPPDGPRRRSGEASEKCIKVRRRHPWHALSNPRERLCRPDTVVSLNTISGRRVFLDL
jgi:hypothetical protein